jgi:lipid-binding SYLF domain-containing protein
MEATMVHLIARAKALGIAAVTAVSVAACADVRQDSGLDARSVVNEATITVERFEKTADLQDFTKHLDTARGVVIFPQLVKGGFFVGAEAGTGLLIKRNDDGSWGYPAFYSVGAGSFGLQIGLQDAELIMIVRTKEGLDAIVDHQGKVGGDVGATIGVFGEGYEAATTTNMDADILAFANGRLGLFIGASVEGMGFIERRDLNKGYYGQVAQARDILQGGGSNAHADALRRLLSRQTAQLTN